MMLQSPTVPSHEYTLLILIYREELKTYCLPFKEVGNILVDVYCVHTQTASCEINCLEEMLSPWKHCTRKHVLSCV